MPKTMTMYQVDAFSTRVFAGNPAAVIVLQQWLDDEVMQAIAAENNLAETAFACARDNGWQLRWFTPTTEVDFCGHATLATAHILISCYKVQGDITFFTRIGALRVSAEDAGYCLDIPAMPAQPLKELPPPIADIFQHRSQNIFRHDANIFVELANEAAVRAFIPDMQQIARLGATGLVITARGEAHDFVSRSFAPGVGIPEDPVTGSTHATLVPWWAEKLGKKTLSAFQASARGGYLRCELAGDRVRIIGEAVIFMKAEIYLPES
ncbi:PhzF family phenazine biosynthesis protein [Affinibrenneria salicis]|uniref:PhzF family phenazine biosynthesis protein n=1 Tax=Affinibrenneria salicis TaxID=2590031 RepID=A0A5J5FZ56_9GAMM|nr:PhzF family phenazine biosynthesis protein [Affinibrenneria salicis]KAA8999461.1 PhzF family phenazine biosynthesis protein [Affinibrenneria salicis]